MRSRRPRPSACAQAADAALQARIAAMTPEQRVLMALSLGQVGQRLAAEARRLGEAPEDPAGDEPKP